MLSSTSAVVPPPLNGLALVPPMTWSSWGSFGCEVNESHIRATADGFVSMGLVKAGYTTLQIDDCWSNKTGRSPTGELLPNATKFPSGMPALAAYLNDRGLQLGIYTDIGTHTCAGFPGSYGHYCQDADTFARWGIRYVKQDFCGWWAVRESCSSEVCYGNMSRCLMATGKPIVFGLCSWGSDQPWMYARKIGANLWRTSADMQPFWESVMRTVDNQQVALDYAGPGGWNDMDELFMSTSAMTFEERRTMMNFFVILASPLAMGDNIHSSTFTPEVLRLYTHPGPISISQDPLGIPGRKVQDSNPGGLQWVTTWARPLHTGEYSVLLFNRGSWGGCMACDAAPSRGCACVGFDFASIGAAFNDSRFNASAVATVFYVWNSSQADGGAHFTGTFPRRLVPPHASLLLRVALV